MLKRCRLIFESSRKPKYGCCASKRRQKQSTSMYLPPTWLVVAVVCCLWLTRDVHDYRMWLKTKAREIQALRRAERKRAHQVSALQIEARRQSLLLSRKTKVCLCVAGVCYTTGIACSSWHVNAARVEGDAEAEGHGGAAAGPAGEAATACGGLTAPREAIQGQALAKATARHQCEQARRWRPHQQVCS